MIDIIFYDFEVFPYDWLVVFIDTATRQKICIKNDAKALTEMYERNNLAIWAGYNNRHYDQYIFKGILLGMDPKPINDYIILQGHEGWQYSSAFNRIRMINYDVMPNPPVSLKTMESFMGSNIKETDVPFNINRKLTPEELKQTEFYCTHDVEETIKVFLQRIDNFDASVGIIKAFPDRVSMWDLGDTEARLTAKVLDCTKHDWHDEFKVPFLPCLRLKKYRNVQDWFAQQLTNVRQRLQSCTHDEEYWVKADFYKNTKLTIDVAGIPHTFGFGGLHGAPDHPVHYTGQILHVDVNNYYPSLLIAWDLVTRSAGNGNYQKVYATRKAMKMKQLAAKTKEEAKSWKKRQLPYKKMLNALSGAMKDPTNAAYDPRNNNTMCINGQLMLLDLIEHLEAGVLGFRLIQSNTDGLIIWIPDTDEAFSQVDDVCYEWESRCSTAKCEIKLALDQIAEIYQKDVNNYLWIDLDGGIEGKGAFVKDLSPLDNDLPILNQAVREYMIHKTPVEETIEKCDDLIMFQHVVKLSQKYDHVEHEEGEPIVHKEGKRKIRYTYEYRHTVRFSYKCFRVFASRDINDGRLLKCGGSRGKPEKFASTPDHTFLWNESTEGVKVPEKLDKKWYIDIARRRLKMYGIEGGTDAHNL